MTNEANGPIGVGASEGRRRTLRLLAAAAAAGATVTAGGLVVPTTALAQAPTAGANAQADKAGTPSGSAPAATSASGSAPTKYPEFRDKLIRIVVPFPAGMGSDNIARVIAQVLPELTGATVIVENKPGGNSVIAVKYLNSLKPDGLAMFLASQSPVAVNAVMFKELGYDPLKDLKPVAQVSRTRWVVLAANDSPHKDFVSLADAARKSGEVVTAGSGSTGYQLGLLLLAQAAGIKINVVPYTGTPQAMNDVIGGQIALTLLDVSTPKPMIEAGRLKPVLTIGDERFARYGDAPSSGELKLPMPALYSWNGIFTTGATPYPVRQRMAEVMRDVVASSAWANYTTQQGSDAVYNGVDATQALQIDQIALYKRAMQVGGIEPQ